MSDFNHNNIFSVISYFLSFPFLFLYNDLFIWFGLVWFGLFNNISTFVSYLMPKASF